MNGNSLKINSNIQISPNNLEESINPTKSKDYQESILYIFDKENQIPKSQEFEHSSSSIDDWKLTTYKYVQGVLDPEEFQQVVKDAMVAMSLGVHPIRIRQGSSGSYFVRDCTGKIIGVFKPKSEEPYGNLNPKWIKRLQKLCFPCFFGRGCLLPNTGYLSECAASVLDRKLGLNIVPRTEIIEFESPSFHYSYADSKAAKKSGRLPKKIGSFQIFLNGYKDTSYIKDFIDYKSEAFRSKPETIQKQYQMCFERLVILDYLARNTDRGMDNWLVYYDDIENMSDGKINSIIRLAGIDNGLAFPYKHPDEWRSYPFGWSWLSCAKEPFSNATVDEFLPIFRDHNFLEGLIMDLHKVFAIDIDFDDLIFKQQMGLLRGQWYNLTEALQMKQSPFDLIKKPLLVIYEEILYINEHIDRQQENESDIKRRLRKMLINVKPWFTWW